MTKSPVSPDHALRALKPYGLTGAQVHLISEVDCVVFRVTASGIAGSATEASAVLKLYPTTKDPANVRAEVEWLEAISLETDLYVPRPLPARDGSVIQSVAVGAFDWPAVLFSWVDGRSVDDGLDEDRLRTVGRFAGTLHRHSQGWPGANRQRPGTRTFTQRVFEWVLRMDRPATLSAQAWDVLQHTARRLEAETTAFGHGADVYGFVHSDLYLSNCLFDGPRLGVIDFSDCGWGHYADDMASALVFLKHPWVGNVDHSREFPGLRDAFFRGYQSAHALPPRVDQMLETYFAARIFLLLAYVHAARDHVSWVRDCVTQSEAFLRAYLDS